MATSALHLLTQLTRPRSFNPGTGYSANLSKGQKRNLFSLPPALHPYSFLQDNGFILQSGDTHHAATTAQNRLWIPRTLEVETDNTVTVPLTLNPTVCGLLSQISRS